MPDVEIVEAGSVVHLFAGQVNHRQRITLACAAGDDGEQFSIG